MYPDINPCYTNPGQGSIHCAGQFGSNLASRNLEKREQSYHPCTAPPCEKSHRKHLLTAFFRRKS
ncbi:MAG: hypothetical protein VB034_14590 [Eubacteriales bacterium]|nr:hypothetical protein [Eubacteriales bacterium]